MWLCGSILALLVRGPRFNIPIKREAKKGRIIIIKRNSDFRVELKPRHSGHNLLRETLRTEPISGPSRKSGPSASQGAETVHSPVTRGS